MLDRIKFYGNIKVVVSDNNRRVASSRIAELAVLVALFVFEISGICKIWSFVACHR